MRNDRIDVAQTGRSRKGLVGMAPHPGEKPLPISRETQMSPLGKGDTQKMPSRWLGWALGCGR